MSEWISVESRLPEDNMKVLIYLRTNHTSWVDTSYFSESYWMDEDEESIDYYISHWMPLPEPPK